MSGGKAPAWTSALLGAVVWLTALGYLYVRPWADTPADWAAVFALAAVTLHWFGGAATLSGLVAELQSLAAAVTTGGEGANPQAAAAPSPASSGSSSPQAPSPPPSAPSASSTTAGGM
jgi:hypothetical protein